MSSFQKGRQTWSDWNEDGYSKTHRQRNIKQNNIQTEKTEKHRNEERRNNYEANWSDLRLAPPLQYPHSLFVVKSGVIAHHFWPRLFVAQPLYRRRRYVNGTQQWPVVVRRRHFPSKAKSYHNRIMRNKKGLWENLSVMTKSTEGFDKWGTTRSKGVLEENST